MPSPNNVLTADSYIQDGLVFQLDGIEYGGIDGQWIDRKQNIRFESSDGSNMFDNNHFQFDGNRYMLTRQSISLNSVRVIQVAFNGLLGRNNVLLYLDSRCKIFTAYYGNLFALGNRCSYYRAGNNLLSVGGLNWIANARKIADVMSGNVNLPIDFPQIAHAGTYYFQGSIYAIRCYSRLLSDREILINQKIDNARFGLGLDIPDDVLPASLSLSLLEPFELTDESESEPEPTNDNLDER